MLNLKVLTILLLLSLTVNAQKIVVLNKRSHAPIPGVEVEAHSFIGVTNKKGEINLKKVNLTEKVYFNHLNYKSKIVHKSKITDTLYLTEISIYLPSTIVTGSIREDIDVKVIPHQAIQLLAEDIKNEKPATAADMLQNSGQVMVQKSQGGGGSPMMRGFEANKLLMVIDGVRLNNAIYRSGHLQNAITIDPSVLSKTEVIFGPSSVLYGSDALGGVIHFHTANPKLADSTKWATATNFSTFYNSNNSSTSTNLNYSIGQKKWGLLTSLSYSKFNDSKMGENRLHNYSDWGLQNHYSKTINGVDSMFVNTNPSIQAATGYAQIDMLSKLILKPTKNLDFTLTFQYSNSSNLNRYDKLNEYRDGKLKYAEWYYGPQKRLLSSFKTHFKSKSKWMNSGNIILSYQNIKEDRISRRFNDLEKEFQFENVDVFAINTDFNKIIDSTRMLYYGLEVQHNIVQSNAYLLNQITNQQTSTQSRYPTDGSQYLSSGIYLGYKQKINKNTVFTTGIRLSYLYANSKFSDTTFIKLPFNEVKISGAAPSGNIGVVFQPDGRTIVKTSLSSAYRSPNVDDYGKVFEKKGNTVVPTNELKPEYAINAELSAERIFGNKSFTTGASVYYTYLFNSIVRSNHTLNGQDSILYNGEMTNIQTNTNTDKAQIYGISLFTNLKLIKNLYLKGTYNYTRGLDFSNKNPLAHIAPQFGKVELEYKNSKFNTAIYSYYNLRKKHTNYGGDSDNLDEAIVDFGTPAWATANFRFSYTGFTNFSLQFSATNLMDINYRQFSSAISAPGRSFMFGLRINL